MKNQASQTLRSALLGKAKEAQTSPGVYLMKNHEETVLYVGKAKILRNRLISYFQPAVHDRLRTEMLVTQIDQFDVILTETESEALILEATLIKKYKPKFNIRLKDDKSYPYLKIQIHDGFPKIVWTRKVYRDGARYFGPFPSSWAARQTLQLLNQTFKLRDCSDNTFSHRSRPCILYQMNQCSAPCVKKISIENYQDAIGEVIQVLEGKGQSLVNSLTQSMEKASENENFEEAAQFRDQIRNLEVVTQIQGVDEAGSLRNRDVLGVARKEVDAHGTVLRIRNGRLTSVQHFSLQNTDPTQSLTEILREFLIQYFVTHQKEGDEEFPSEFPVMDAPSREVLLTEAPEDLELLEKSLSIQIRVAESTVDQQLLNVAKTNAEHALEQNIKKKSGHGAPVLDEVQKKLHLQKFPHRIECYDISNIQGENAVASRVVFIDGAPDKQLYRRYQIKTVEGANDFAMMKEVLLRRFSKLEEELPDLVVVDGGKGQLSQVVAVLEELSIQGIDVVGLAKARVESNFKSSEVKSSLERIFIPNRVNPIPLLPHSGVYKILTHIRDEAHRFAITYHRLLRSKRSLKSDLD